jgi:hypothetical protein
MFIDIFSQNEGFVCCRNHCCDFLRVICQDGFRNAFAYCVGIEKGVDRFDHCHHAVLSAGFYDASQEESTFSPDYVLCCNLVGLSKQPTSIYQKLIPTLSST